MQPVPSTSRLLAQTPGPWQVSARLQSDSVASPQGVPSGTALQVVPVEPPELLDDALLEPLEPLLLPEALPADEEEDEDEALESLDEAVELPPVLEPLPVEAPPEALPEELSVPEVRAGHRVGSSPGLTQ